MSEKSTENKEYSSQEKKLIQYIRALSFGELKVIVQEGQPIRIEDIKKSIKL